METDFFVVGFFAVVVDFLAEAAFLVAPGLAVRDPLERDGDFFATAVASGAGEARGDGRGEDIVGMELAVVVENDGGGDKESCIRALRAPRPRDFISVDGTERVASRVRSSCGSCCLLIAKPYLHPHSHRPFPPYKTAPASCQQFSAPTAQGQSRNPSKSCDEAGSDDMEFRVNSHRYTSTHR